MTLKYLISPEERRRGLKRALESKKLIKGIEVHNAIGALIINDLRLDLEDNGNKKTKEYDFFWESSLTDSASKGYPDIEIISFDQRIKTISEILEVTNKPMILDGDTGGNIRHFEYLIPKLEKMGISAIIIEDKVFPKRNSLEPGTNQDLEDPDRFAEKIIAGKTIQRTEDFMIIARLESLIAGECMEEALFRAKKYLLAGADGIMIHSRSKSPDEILKFAEKYQEICKEVNRKAPLVCVPTTYNSIYESELEKNGFNIVIYANHMLRASYKSMKETAKIILQNERSLEAEPFLISVNEIFEKVGFLDIKEKDKQQSVNKLSIIIPAAGKDPEIFLENLPKPLIKINDKSILEHQISLFKKFNLNDINVTVGYEKEKFNIPDVNYIPNEEYSSTGILHSLMKAKEKMKKGFIYISSDVLIDEKLMRELLLAKGDIILVVDNSYIYHKHEVDKKLDAVVTKYGRQAAYQGLRPSEDEVFLIGKNIPGEKMSYEFIGISKFSEKGAEILIKVYEECKNNSYKKFHESENFKKASDLDIFQELIDRGFKISILETHGGWIEIHNNRDLDFAQKILNNLGNSA